MSAMLQGCLPGYLWACWDLQKVVHAGRCSIVFLHVYHYKHAVYLTYRVSMTSCQSFANGMHQHSQQSCSWDPSSAFADDCSVPFIQRSGTAAVSPHLPVNVAFGLRSASSYPMGPPLSLQDTILQELYSYCNYMLLARQVQLAYQSTCASAGLSHADNAWWLPLSCGECDACRRAPMTTAPTPSRCTRLLARWLSMRPHSSPTPMRMSNPWVSRGWEWQTGALRLSAERPMAEFATPQGGGGGIWLLARWHGGGRLRGHFSQPPTRGSVVNNTPELAASRHGWSLWGSIHLLVRHCRDPAIASVSFGICGRSRSAPAGDCSPSWCAHTFTSSTASKMRE